MDSVFHYYNTSSIVASIFCNNPGGLEGTLGHWHKGWAKDGKNIKKTGPRNEKNNQTMDHLMRPFCCSTFHLYFHLVYSVIPW